MNFISMIQQKRKAITKKMYINLLLELTYEFLR